MMLGVHLINKKLLPMKMHYFFYTGCITTIMTFGPTYAKQLGYSKITVSFMMMCLFNLSMMAKPVIGAIVDKFRVKRYLFLVFIFLTGISAFFVMFVRKLPQETSSELYCDTTTTLINIYYENSKKLSNCDKKTLMENNGEELVNCKLKCNNNDLSFPELFTFWNGTQYYTPQNDQKIDTSNVNDVEINNNDLSVWLNLYNLSTKQDIKKQVGSYNFRVQYVDLNDTVETFPSCRRPTKIPCDLNCSNEKIMELATTTTSQETVLFKIEFWEFFSLLCIFWISQSGVWAIQDPVCFDLLEEKHSDFGKQRCWTSIGWGVVSVLGGWLVDYFSSSGIYKNYTPIAYVVLAFMVLDLIFASKITVVEFKTSNNTCQNVFKLFKDHQVISFFLWIFLLGVYSSLTMSYLFWYLEDVASEYNCDQLMWMKTLQGLSQGLQSFAGEMPVFFCSGWIINTVSHKHCLSLILFGFTVRFFGYSIMTNPVWSLLIEILNGMMYALSRAMMVSYTRRISPQSTHHTVLGLVGLFDCIGVSLGGVVAGHLYEFYGGAWLFRSYTYSSAVMCVLQIIYNLTVKVN